jgi:hypothetical protein
VDGSLVEADQLLLELEVVEWLAATMVEHVSPIDNPDGFHGYLANAVYQHKNGLQL